MQLFCAELVWGLAGALAGVILLLLADTEVLSGPWLVILFLSGCAYGVWRAHRRKPTAYESAQHADRRLGSHDLLSTAFHFRDSPSSIAVLQRQEAARVVAATNPAQAAPWSTPKQVWIAATLLTVVLGLCGLRYGLLGTIGIEQPTIAAVADFFHPNREVSVVKRRSQSFLEDAPPQWLPFDRDKKVKFDEFGSLPPDVLQELQKAANEMSSMDSTSDGLKKAENGEKTIAQKSETSEGFDSKQPTDEKSSTEGDSGMMNQFKEAMSDLMAKMSTPKENAGPPKQSQQPKQSGGEAEKAQGQGDPSQSKDGEVGDEDAGEGDQDEQQGSSSNASQNAAQGAALGAGKGEGDKNTHMAEQLAAMGKLSELLGKRSLMLTGDVTIESEKAEKQNLITSYDNRGQVKAEAGGEIRRDEVPAQMQPYVRQYFEQVRKTGPQKTAAAPAGKK